MTPDRARRAIALIDLTDLDDDASADSVDQLCARAVEHGTAAVCVWPEFVARASDRVRDHGVLVATVVNFPSGDERPFEVQLLTDRCLADGADEIDLVLPYRAMLAGRLDRVADTLTAIRQTTTDHTLKVIVESGELVDADNIRCAADLAIEHGADFVKTSTGKTPVSATPEAAEIVLAAIATAERSVGFKPSGGIRTAADAARYLDLAEAALGGELDATRFRFGASGLLDALLDAAKA